WMRLMPRGVLYVAGLIVLIGLLCAQAVWFASFFAFIGYLHSWQYLRGAWRFAGVTATAAISVTAFFGGPPEPVPSEILSYLLLTSRSVAAVVLFSSIGETPAQRGDERRQMVARPEETRRENAGLHAQL